MITEDYVSFETAKLLKEKGFNIPITSVWVDHSKMIDYPAAISIYPYKEDWNSTKGGLEDIYFSAPTLQMAMKWLREVHDLHIDIFVTYKDGIPHYQWSVDILKTQDAISETPCCSAYEEACEAAIKYCLENLI